MLSASFSIIKFLADLATLAATSSASGNKPANPQQTSSVKAIARSHKFTFLSLFVFLFLDVYVRTIPMILFPAVMYLQFFGSQTASWYLFCIGYFGVFAIFEFVANRQIRDPLQRDWSLIFKVFAASICSSFHSVLSTLHLLRNDNFYAKSVIFGRFSVAHGVRCGISMLLAVATGILMSQCDRNCESRAMIEWLLGFFVVFWIFNLVTLYWIYRHVDVSKTSTPILNTSPQPAMPSMVSV